MKGKRGVHFNYFFDGPCGDCPKKFVCDNSDCVHWLAWEEVERTVWTLAKKAHIHHDKG